MSDVETWPQVGWAIEPLELTLNDINAEALDTFFGGKAGGFGKPEFSITFDTTEEVSAAPARPEYKKGLWARLTGENRRRFYLYRKRHLEWQLAGCPSKTVVSRTFIPRAVLS